MRNEYLKTLWMLRFEKMRQCEEEAAWNYQGMRDECLAALGQDDEAVILLAQLVREERAHEKMAEELIKICHHNHPEADALLP